MYLTALVQHPEHVCCRYRLAAFRSFFEAAGHRLELRSRPGLGWEWLQLGRHLSRADAVILQRKLLPDWQLRLLRSRASLLIFDFDDAIFLRNSFSHKPPDCGRRRRRFEAVVQAADVVIAGNAFLAEHAIRHAGADRVQIIPTHVNPAGYPLAEHVRAGEGVELAWIGASSTLRALERARLLFEQLGRSVSGLRLKIIGDRFLRFHHLPVVDCAWSEAGEAEALASADIGISWLPDDAWSRGKCGLKVLQYMAAGLPVVANPVGVQAEMVSHAETGFLAETPQEWIEAVRRLASDPALRRQMGRAGRRRLEAEFAVARGARRWLTVIDQLQGSVIRSAL